MFALQDFFKIPRLILSPFDFGKPTKAYSYAYKNGALSRVDNKIFALLTWVYDNPGQKTYGVLETNFDQTSGDIELDVTNFVDYDSSYYTNRMYLKGNEKTHTFTLKFAMPAEKKDWKAFSIIGTGVSRSDNPADYFLLKVKSHYKQWDPAGDSTILIYPEGRYFKFSAGVNEDSLKLYPDFGYPKDSIVDPNGYLAVQDTMAFFDLNCADNPTAVTDFRGGTVELDY